MGDFEYFSSFLGLVLGLSVAELLSKFADALGARHKVQIGWLTPMLAACLLLGVTTVFIHAWDTRAVIIVSWRLMFACTLIAGAYYLAAALVFPRDIDEWPSLDEYYWRHKLGIVWVLLVTNTLSVIYASLLQGRNADLSPRFWVWQFFYYAPLLVLVWSRRRQRVDIAALGVMIVQYLAQGSDLV